MALEDMANGKSLCRGNKQDADWRIGWIKDGFPVWPLILQRREESEIAYLHSPIPFCRRRYAFPS
jgi:hypothetical protein